MSEYGWHISTVSTGKYSLTITSFCFTDKMLRARCDFADVSSSLNEKANRFCQTSLAPPIYVLFKILLLEALLHDLVVCVSTVIVHI